MSKKFGKCRSTGEISALIQIRTGMSPVGATRPKNDHQRRSQPSATHGRRRLGDGKHHLSRRRDCATHPETFQHGKQFRVRQRVHECSGKYAAVCFCLSFPKRNAPATNTNFSRPNAQMFFFTQTVQNTLCVGSSRKSNVATKNINFSPSETQILLLHTKSPEHILCQFLPQKIFFLFPPLPGHQSNENFVFCPANRTC